MVQNHFGPIEGQDIKVFIMSDHKISRKNEIMDAHTKMISPHCALHCHVKACKGMLCI